MKILALEFSSERRSVAVVVEGRMRGRAEETGGRTARAFALIERALAEAGLEREGVDCLAVGLGPGSYAGIRAAIALAQGWQIARPVRLLGISSVECLAAQAQAENVFGCINVLIDAQRQEFYCAGYQVEASGRRLVAPLRLIDFNTAALLHDGGDTLIVGTDLQKHFPKAHVLAPDAAQLGLLATCRTDFVTGDKLEPIYLRDTAVVKAPPPRIIPPL
jgi:tRNA threonylcarbamoyl adenosine modification protein YeaZ